MTLKEAFAEALTCTTSTPTELETAIWRNAEKTLVKHHYCPHCACDGDRIRLGRWQPGNYYEHAGRECPQCEAFVVCGEQAEYEPDNWRGDAAPGL